MQPLRVALAQTNWPGSREEIIRTYRELAAEAAGRGAGLLCLQEFTLSPYFASVIDQANYAWAEPLTGGESDRFFSELARTNGLFLVGSLFERADDERYWDTAVLYNPAGEQIGHTRKVHIPQGAGYHEHHYFASYDQYPVHDIGGVATSLPTCYDQWFPELSRICALNGAEFIFYPTAIGSEPDAPEMDSADAWQTVMRGQAIANGVFIAAANRTGVEGVTFYGSSFLCDPMGHVLAQASRDRTEVIVADLDPAVFALWRKLFPLLKQRRPGVYGRLVEE